MATSQRMTPLGAVLFFSLTLAFAVLWFCIFGSLAPAAVKQLQVIGRIDGAPRLACRVTSIAIETYTVHRSTRRGRDTSYDRFRPVITFAYVGPSGTEVFGSTKQSALPALRSYTPSERAHRALAPWAAGTAATIALVDGTIPVFEPDSSLHDWYRPWYDILSGWVGPAATTAISIACILRGLRRFQRGEATFLNASTG